MPASILIAATLKAIQITAAICCGTHQAPVRSRGAAETDAVAIAAADAACKVAEVLVRDTRFAVDLAGNAYFTLTGTLDAIEAAAAAATDAASDRLVGLEVIAQPAPELRGRLFR